MVNKNYDKRIKYKIINCYRKIYENNKLIKKIFKYNKKEEKTKGQMGITIVIAFLCGAGLVFLSPILLSGYNTINNSVNSSSKQ